MGEGDHMTGRKQSSVSVLSAAEQTTVTVPVLTPETKDTLRILKDIIAAGKSIDIELPAALEERKALIVQWVSKHSQLTAKIGFALVSIREEMRHGEWQAWMREELDFSARTAQGYMRVARLLLAISDPSRAKVARLPLRKQILLTRAAPATIDALVAAGALDEAEELHEEQIKEIIGLRKQVEKAERETERLQRAQHAAAESRRSPEYRWPEYVAAARDECYRNAVIIEQATEALHSQQVTIAEHFRAARSDDQRTHAQDAMAALWWNAAGAAVKLMQYVERLREALPDDITARLAIHLEYQLEDVDAVLRQQQELIRTAEHGQIAKTLTQRGNIDLRSQRGRAR